MPYDRHLYPANWKSIAAAAKAAAMFRCERCGKQHGERAINRFGQPITVVVTTAHPDHDPHNPHARLAVWCAQCHLRYDNRQRRRKAHMMAIARGQLAFWDDS